MASSSEIKQALRQHGSRHLLGVRPTQGRVSRSSGKPCAARPVRKDRRLPPLVHRLTGSRPIGSAHIPWDRVDDYGKTCKYASTRGCA